MYSNVLITSTVPTIQVRRVGFVNQPGSPLIKDEDEFEQKVQFLPCEQSAHSAFSRIPLKTEDEGIVPIKPEIFDSTEQISIKKEEDDESQYCYFSETEDDDSEEDSDDECDCQACLAKDIILIEADEYEASRENRLAAANNASEMDVSDLPDHLIGCLRVLRNRRSPRTGPNLESTHHQSRGRRAQTQKKVFRCTFDSCGQTFGSRQTIYIHCRIRHFNVAPTIQEQKKQGKLEQQKPSLFVAEELAPILPFPLTIDQEERLEAEFAKSHKLNYYQREDLAFNMKMCESRIVTWFQSRRRKAVYQRKKAQKLRQLGRRQNRSTTESSSIAGHITQPAAVSSHASALPASSVGDDLNEPLPTSTINGLSTTHQLHPLLKIIKLFPAEDKEKAIAAVCAKRRKGQVFVPIARKGNVFVESISNGAVVSCNTDSPATNPMQSEENSAQKSSVSREAVAPLHESSEVDVAAKQSGLDSVENISKGISHRYQHNPSTSNLKSQQHPSAKSNRTSSTSLTTIINSNLLPRRRSSDRQSTNERKIPSARSQTENILHTSLKHRNSRSNRTLPPTEMKPARHRRSVSSHSSSSVSSSKSRSTINESDSGDCYLPSTSSDYRKMSFKSKSRSNGHKYKPSTNRIKPSKINLDSRGDSLSDSDSYEVIDSIQCENTIRSEHAKNTQKDQRADSANRELHLSVSNTENRPSIDSTHGSKYSKGSATASKSVPTQLSSVNESSLEHSAMVSTTDRPKLPANAVTSYQSDSSSKAMAKSQLQSDSGKRKRDVIKDHPNRIEASKPSASKQAPINFKKRASSGTVISQSSATLQQAANHESSAPTQDSTKCLLTGPLHGMRIEEWRTSYKIPRKSKRDK